MGLFLLQGVPFRSNKFGNGDPLQQKRTTFVVRFLFVTPAGFKPATF